jgi:hypothetical protein
MEYRHLEEVMVAALASNEHHQEVRGGLPRCSCGWPLGGGRATEEFIVHALAFVEPIGGRKAAS